MSFPIEKPTEELLQEIYDAEFRIENFQGDMGCWFEDSVWPKAIDVAFVTGPGEWHYLDGQFSIVTDMEERLCLRIKFRDLRIHAPSVSLDVEFLDIPVKQLEVSHKRAIQFLTDRIRHILRKTISSKEFTVNSLSSLLTVYELGDQEMLERFVIGA